VLRDNAGRVNSDLISDLSADPSAYLTQSKCGGHLRKAMRNRWINRRSNSVNVNYRASPKAVARAPWRRLTWDSR